MSGDPSCCHQDVEDGKHEVAVGKPVEGLADHQDHAGGCDAGHTAKPDILKVLESVLRAALSQTMLKSEEAVLWKTLRSKAHS